MIKRQDIIIDKIADYLQYDLAINGKDQLDIKNRQEIINSYRKSEGICGGLSKLWGYGKYIQNKPNKDNKQRDDYEFFKNTLETLTNWNEETILTPNEKFNIERLISNITLYQTATEGNIIPNTSEQNQENFLEVNHFPHKIQKVFENEMVSNQKILTDRLEKILKPNTIILFAGIKGNNGHEVSIYVNSQTNKIDFYDPNIGEFNFNTVGDLVETLWNSIKISGKLTTIGEFLFHSSLRFFSIQIFTENTEINFDMSKEQFHNNYEELLNIFNNNLKLFTQYTSLSSVKSFIQQISGENILNLLKTNEISENIKQEMIKIYVDKFDTTQKELAEYLVKNFYDLIPSYRKAKIEDVANGNHYSHKTVINSSPIIAEINDSAQQINVHSLPKVTTESFIDISSSINILSSENTSEQNTLVSQQAVKPTEKELNMELQNLIDEAYKYTTNGRILAKVMDQLIIKKEEFTSTKMLHNLFNQAIIEMVDHVKHASRAMNIDQILKLLQLEKVSVEFIENALSDCLLGEYSELEKSFKDMASAKIQSAEVLEKIIDISASRFHYKLVNQQAIKPTEEELNIELQDLINEAYKYTTNGHILAKVMDQLIVKKEEFTSTETLHSLFNQAIIEMVDHVKHASRAMNIDQILKLLQLEKVSVEFIENALSNCLLGEYSELGKSFKNMANTKIQSEEVLEKIVDISVLRFHWLPNSEIVREYNDFTFSKFLNNKYGHKFGTAFQELFKQQESYLVESINNTDNILNLVNNDVETLGID